MLLGLLGGRERFDQLTGQHTRVGHVIAGFGEGPVSNILAAMGEVPMLGIESSSLTSHDVAQGRGDSWLAEVNQSPWDIARQPRSRAAYRKLVIPLGR